MNFSQETFDNTRKIPNDDYEPSPNEHKYKDQDFKPTWKYERKDIYMEHKFTEMEYDKSKKPDRTLGVRNLNNELKWGNIITKTIIIP